METRRFENMGDLSRAAESMRAEGWTVLPCDEPEVASFGAVAYPANTPPEEEETSKVLLEWLPFGRRLEPEVHVAKDAQEFEDMLDSLRRDGTPPGLDPARRAPMVLPCDDPKKARIGFVAYTEDGRARVVRIGITQTSQMSRELLAELRILAHLRTGLRDPAAP